VFEFINGKGGEFKVCFYQVWDAAVQGAVSMIKINFLFKNSCLYGEWLVII